MKTKNTTLKFENSAVLELQNEALLLIHGGSTVAGGPTCSGCMCNEINRAVNLFNNMYN